MFSTFLGRSWRGVLDTTLCDKVCQWLAAGRWFSPRTPVSSTNKTDRHDITEILLKVALNILTLTLSTKLLMVLVANNINKFQLYISSKYFRVRGENHRPVANHWQLYCCIEHTLSWAGFDLTTLVLIATDCIGSYKSNHHTITNTMTLKSLIK
jgi:hypothetical protein